MTEIISAIRDLLKFSIIKNVDTGDRSLDGLLHVMLIALITYISGSFVYASLKIKIKIYFSKCRKNKVITLNEESYKHYYDYANKKENFSQYRFATWFMRNDIEFTEKLIRYISTVYSKTSDDNIPVYCMKKCEVIKSSLFCNSSTILSNFCSGAKILYPIYLNNGKIIGLRKTDDGTAIFYEDETMFKQFIKMIHEIKIIIEDEKKEEIMEKKIQINNGELYRLYTNRDMNLIVSKHKKRIINMLNNFTKTNSGNPNLGGYGTYNLGIMMYGKPGCGKTLFAKSVANYLKRNIKIIDMRTITTRKSFEDIFYNENLIQNNVFVLDEFDCVQGIIQNRSTLTNETKESDGLTILKGRQMELLKLLVNDKGEVNNAATNPIKIELNEIKDKINNAVNALTIDTMLQVLDGVIEMRNRVIIATTNHIENIDPALMRDGRFDAKIELSEFNNEEAHEFLEKIYKDTADKQELYLLNKTKIREIYTPTQLINMASSYSSLTRVLDIIKE